MSIQTFRKPITILLTMTGLLLAACQPIQPAAESSSAFEFSALRQNVATQLSITSAEITIVSAEPVEWPDACLGVSADGEICAAVITPGYKVTLEANGEQYIYHTNLTGDNHRLAQAAQPQKNGAQGIEMSDTMTGGLSGNLTGDGPIFVDEVTINLMESMPVQVNAVVRGMLPDPCTKITKALAQLEGNTFVIIIATERDDKMMCAQVLSPFEQVIELDVKGVAAGEYRVVANEVTTTFTLQ